MTSSAIFLTRWGEWKFPKVPVPQRYNWLVSWDIEALKLPAATNFMGTWEMS
jgi:hypothetical protein